jgi:hypothetical protein
MTPLIFSLWLHLAGAAPYGDGMTYATEGACKQAGEAWLKRVRHRSANDWFECGRVK